MKRVSALTSALLFLITFSFAAYAQEAKKEAPDDKKFVTKAASGGLFEVEAGKLATQKAASDEVKKFGQRMVDEHSKANDELMQIADKKGMKPPKQIDKKHKAQIDKITKLSGEEFDREYMSMMVKDHKNDVSLYSKQADKGKDPDLKAFASKNVPILKEHLKLAQDISAKVGPKKGGEKGK
jgi:putative membrane protein